MYTRRTVLYLFLVIGVLSTGFTSDNQKNKGTSEEVNQVNKAGLKQGPWEIYDDSVIISKGSYLDDIPDGMWTSWYKSGQMKEEGHYKEGIKNGMWIEWYPDGEIMWKGEWDNGTRKIEHIENQADISFIGAKPENDVMAGDSLYRLRIRIQNIPASNLFVEVSSGEITRGDESDLFILKTSSDSMLTIAIGYMPDLDFRDFRNLITEIDFKLR